MSVPLTGNFYPTINDFNGPTGGTGPVGATGATGISGGHPGRDDTFVLRSIGVYAGSTQTISPDATGVQVVLDSEFYNNTVDYGFYEDGFAQTATNGVQCAETGIYLITVFCDHASSLENSQFHIQVDGTTIAVIEVSENSYQTSFRGTLIWSLTKGQEITTWIKHNEAADRIFSNASLHMHKIS